MIDKKFIGTESPPVSIEVEKYPIRLFALSIGETNPIHTDEAAAKAAGYASLVAPPTYAFCLNSMAAQGGGARNTLYQDMGVNMARVLHGEQSFTYHKPIVAGDVLTFRPKIVDIYDKKNGTLDFIVQETAVTNQRGERVVDTRTVIVVRN
ncbi:MAG: MaoC family dehydratase [Alphaproteobacteria bacterium]|nr:MaoC family dehydratase [Alphaproteobacteria bacterium]